MVGGDAHLSIEGEYAVLPGHHFADMIALDQPSADEPARHPHARRSYSAMTAASGARATESWKRLASPSPEVGLNTLSVMQQWRCESRLRAPPKRNEAHRGVLQEKY